MLMARIYGAKVINARVRVYWCSILGLGLGYSKLWLDLGLGLLIRLLNIKVLDKG